MTLDDSTRPLRDEACAPGADGASPLHPLARLAVLVTAEVSAVASRNGLTPMHARMLGLLSHGPQRMADLAQSLGVEKAALTGLVDRAKSRGLVARQTVPSDRRSILIAITDDGATASAAFYTQLNDELDAMIDQLPVADREPYSAWTRHIIAARAAGGQAGQQPC